MALNQQLVNQLADAIRNPGKYANEGTKQARQRDQEARDRGIPELQAKNSGKGVTSYTSPSLGNVTRANAKEDTRTAEQKMNAAQRALNIHNAVQGEKKPVEKTPLQKAMDDLFRQPAGASVSDAPVQMDKSLQQPDQDARRKELEATVEHYRQQMQAEEDRAVMDADMAEFNSWPEEDREALKTYIIQDAQEKNNPFSTPSLYSARYNATNLFNKYGAQKVKEMAESYRRSENEKTAQEVAQIGRENTGVLSNAATVGLNLMGNLASPLGYLQETTERTGRYSTMDANNAGNLFNTYSGAVRQQTAQNIAGDVYDENGNLVQEGGMGRQLLSYGYQTLMSAADSIARAAVGGGVGGKAGKAISLGLAGLGSWGQTMSQASAQGATPTQAAILATANAGIEVATEFIPLDELLKTAKGGVGKIMPVLIATMKQAGIEATTEEISLLGTLIAEAAFLQEKSSYAQTINALVANGATIEEATAQADAQVWQEVKDTAIISAGSGGMSGFGSGLKGVKAQAQQTVDAMEAQKAHQPEAQPASPKMEQLDKAIAETLGVQPAQATDNSTGNKSIKLYRGYNQSDDPTQKNLTSQQSVYSILGREDPNEIKNLLPLAYYTENEEDARSYADMDVRQMDEYRKNGIYEYRDRVMRGKDVEGLSEEEYADKAAKRSFLALHGREPNAGGRVERYDYTPGKVLDLTELGDMTNVDAAYKVLADKFGIEPSELDNILTMGNNFENDFPVFALLRNTPRDNLGTKIADLAKKAGYDSIHYSEDGNSHYAIITDRQGWDKNLIKDSGEQNFVAQNPSVKGTGAAEQNFSQKPAYNATLSADNAQADRATDVRPMELPQIDVNGGNVSAVTGNTYGSQNTPDDLASAMEEPVARGDFSYEKITNNQATERAMKSIEQAGSWDSAYSQFQRDVGEGKAGAELSARAALLLNHAAEEYQIAKDSGNEELAASKKREWLGILSDVQRLGTNTAQGIQAMRIIRSLMPQDKLEFAKVSVQRMAADMRIDVTIDQNLLDQYENAETDEARNEILEQIQQNVADQIPSTALDKFTALRYTNMLGNLKTNVRNVAGNLGSKAVYKMKDTVATVMEEIASAATGGKFQKTKSLTVDPALLEACRRDFQDYKDLVSSGGKYGDRMSDSDQFRQGVMDKRRVFKSNAKNDTVRKVSDAIMAPMEGYRKATNWLMNNEYFGDEAFGRAAYARALAGYLKANGVKGYDLSKVDSALMDKARAYAIKEAQEATFHDNSTLARIVSKAQKGFGWVGQGVMPFTKTPANVLTRAEEFSPIGLINSTVKSFQKAASGTKLSEGNGKFAQWVQNGQDVTGADIINSWAKTLTGTALFALGAAMLDQGLLTGGPDEDDEKEAFENMNGQQNYAIQLPDGTTYTIDWLTPAAMPMFMGAQLWKIVSEKGGLSNLNFSDYEQVFTAIADPMLQMSMLSGLNDTLGNIQNADNNIGQFFLNAAVSYLSQGLSNTLLGQIERSTEKNRQTTYIDKDSSTPQWMQRQLGSISQKIPGWDYQQVDYINAWGEKQENKGGLGYNLLSPGYLNEADNSELTQELTRLRETTGENIFPDNASKTITYTDSSGEVHKDYNLTPEQYETLATTQGQTAKAMIGQMIKSKDYQTMDDDQKAKAIEQVYSYAKTYAETKAIEDHTGFDESWMMEIDEPTSEQAVKKGTDYIMRRVTKSELTNAFTALDTAWDKGYKDSGRADDLKWAYDVFAAMTPAAKADVKEWLSGDSAKYVEAREKGVSHEQFLTAAKNVNTVKGTGKNGAVKDIDKRQAIAETDGIPDAVIDKIMKAYMGDYDPDDSSSEKTELKYDYIRHGMGLSPEQYAETYRAYLEEGKSKNEKIADIVAIGYDRNVAAMLYAVYASSTAGKNAYMKFYENSR